MQVEDREITSLQPYDRNPRKNDKAVARVAASIREFGFKVPVIVDGSGVVVAGHTRIKAAQSLGMDRVPVIVADDLTPDQIRAFRLADNRVAEWAEWDIELLAGEIKDLKDLVDIGVLGFKDHEISALLRVGGDVGREDETPAAQANPVAQLGDVWLLGRHRLMCGDSTSADDVDRLLHGAAPPLMVTDPPYGVGYDANWRNEADRASGVPYGAIAIGRVDNDDRADWREAWGLFPGDVAYVWHAGTFAHVVAESLEASGFAIRSQIVWAKSRLVIGRGHYHHQHEPCWYAVRKGATGRWEGDRTQTTLWQIDHQKSETGHSTQKPVECMRRPMQNNSKSGEIVYDPFMGSGTSLIAAQTIDRVCYGMELNPVYVDVAVRRWENFTGMKAELENARSQATA